MVSRFVGRAIALMGLLCGALVLPQQASALVLLDEDFQGQTISNGLTVNLLDNPGNTANDNLDQWIDFPNSNRWGISSGGFCSGPCSGDFAQHNVPTDGDQTNLLFYAFDASGLGVGTQLTLMLDHIASNRAGRAFVAGMLNGVHALDPFAPWFDDESNPMDPPDGNVLISEALARTSTWTGSTFQTTLTQEYDAIAVAVRLGGISGMRGVDNIKLEATLAGPSDLPEPASITLFGFGVAGLVFAARRRRRAA